MAAVQVLPTCQATPTKYPDVDNPIIANIAPMDVVLAGGPVPTNAFVLALNDFTTADYPALGRLYFIVGDKDGGPTDFYLLPVQPYSDGTQTAGPYDVLEAPNGWYRPGWAATSRCRHRRRKFRPWAVHVDAAPLRQVRRRSSRTVMYGAHSDPSLDNLTVVGVSNLSAIPGTTRRRSSGLTGSAGSAMGCIRQRPSPLAVVRSTP